MTIPDGTSKEIELKEKKDPFIGVTISERYLITSIIGSGGMGNVYLAEHVLLKKKVAVKILHFELSKNKDTLERFKREAIAASNIGQSNIVDVTDFGYTEQGNAFFVMEYVEGESLAEIIKKRSPLPLHHVIAISAQVALALYNAHGKGIVHRDMKPENILITAKDEISPFVKIVDFGISKIIGTNVTSRKERTLTKTGAIFGTPEYMSPEQAGGQQVDTRTDIYSLGVMMYEMLTGKLPFTDQNYMKVLHKHQYEIPDLPSSKEQTVPSEMDAIVMRCLEKNAANRYPTMLDLIADLKRVYTQYGLEKRINLAFLLNSTVISRAEGDEPSPTAKETPSERDMLLMLNQGTMAGRHRERTDTVASVKKKSALITVVIVIVLLLVATVLIYRTVTKKTDILVAERSQGEDPKKSIPEVKQKELDRKPPSQKEQEPKTYSGKKGVGSSKRNILLTVNANVDGVTVVNNETGKTLCVTPCKIKLPKDEGAVMVLGFKKDDFNIRPMAIALDRDMTVNVDLKQLQ